MRKPDRRSATAGMATNAATPSVPAAPSASRSARLRSKPAAPGPCNARNAPRATTIITVLPIGATAVTVKRRWAWRTAVVIAPTAYSNTWGTNSRSRNVARCCWAAATPGSAVPVVSNRASAVAARTSAR